MNIIIKSPDNDIILPNMTTDEVYHDRTTTVTDVLDDILLDHILVDFTKPNVLFK